MGGGRREGVREWICVTTYTHTLTLVTLTLTGEDQAVSDDVIVLKGEHVARCYANAVCLLARRCCRLWDRLEEGGVSGFHGNGGGSGRGFHRVWIATGKDGAGSVG